MAQAQTDTAVLEQVETLMRARKDALIMRWIIATSVVGVYAVGLAIFAQTIPTPVRPILVALFALLAAAFALASIVVPRKLLTDAQLAEHLDLPIDAYRWARKLRLKSRQVDAFVALPARAQRVLGLTLLFDRPFQLSLMLASGVAFVGLLYGLLSRTLLEAAPFFLVALALNCWHYPRLPKFVERARKLARMDKVSEGTEALRMLDRIAQAEAAPRQPGRRPRFARKVPPPHGPVKS